MQTISKSKLNANMLEIFQHIETSGEELIVTHHSKPILRIIPIQQGKSVDAVFANWRGQVTYHADLDEPTLDEWADI